jgi:16S rRNA (cytosine967-C5)-methyltransferase
MPRALAQKVLDRLDLNPGFPERYLERAFQQEPGFDERDRAFAIHLVQGVLRWRLRIDWIIEKNLRFSFNKIAPPILNILRMGVYQIFFMDRVPDSAAVDQAVKQAKAAGRRHVAGFVNGILRNICRQKDQIVFPLRETDLTGYLSVYYSYPTWLVKKWIREQGVNSTERLLEAGNKVPLVVVRTNTEKIDREGLIKVLKEEGITGKPTTYSPEGIRLDSLKGPVNLLKSFQGGLFQVQGEAAQICSHLISPGPDDVILDLCAGLGGKSTQMAQLTADKARIVALDISHSRLVRLSHSTCRLGILPIEPVVADAVNQPSFLFRRNFDKILIDAPCSGLGVISKHPDGKWTRNESDIRRLARLQKNILNQAVPLLKMGGWILYVTCTISGEENEGVVHDFLKVNSGMALENLRDFVPEWCTGLIDEQGFFRTIPHVHGMEGFFGALLIKQNTGQPPSGPGKTEEKNLWEK